MKLKGTFKNGFRYSIDTDFVNDYEFLGMLAKVEENPIYIIEIVNLIFGEKQKENLINYIKKKEGKVKITTMNNLIKEVFESLQANKNIKN